MRKVVLFSLVMVFSASLAFAQAGAPNIFQDADGMSCDLVAPSAPGLWSVYVVHMLSPAASAIQFYAPMPECIAASGISFLSDTAIYPVTVGGSQTGVSIGYGLCVPSPNHVLTINMFAGGAPVSSCCFWPVLPDPNAPSGKIEVVDCEENLLFVDSQPSAVVNSDDTCECFEPIANENSTWGGVKALYAD